MRRGDRELTRREDLAAVLRECKVCRLGLWDGKEVYIVPMNFGYFWEGEALTLYFHCAGEGRKLELLARRPEVSFEMDCGHRLVEGVQACQYAYSFSSLMGTGKAALVTDPAEKARGLTLLMEHQAGKTFSFGPRETDAVTVVKLTVETLSGKRHE